MARAAHNRDAASQVCQGCARRTHEFVVFVQIGDRTFTGEGVVCCANNPGCEAAIEKKLRLRPVFQGAGGDTYLHRRDGKRLGAQFQRVWSAMRDYQYRTYDQINAITGDPVQSISARLRDFNKRDYAHLGIRMERRAVDAARGIYEYRLCPADTRNESEALRNETDKFEEVA